jgi:hypothetical protein
LPFGNFVVGLPCLAGIGFLFLILAINPQKYRAMLAFAGYFMIIEGIVLLVYGLVLDLDLIPFCVDVAFCIIIGIGIVLSQKGIESNDGNV